MAFKELCLFSTLMMIAVVNYNVMESEAYLTAPQLANSYLSVQRDLYELQQSELNLMNDSQKLYDLLNQYLSGRIPNSAVDAAQAELLRSRADWYRKAMQYLHDSTNFEPASNYPYGPVDPLAANPAYTNSLYSNTAVAPAIYDNSASAETDTTVTVTTS